MLLIIGGGAKNSPMEYQFDPEGGQQLSLSYKGYAVENGEMLVDDVAEVLQGFSSAYGKLAKLAGIPEPVVSIKAIRPGSFEILLNAYQEFQQQPLMATASITAIIAAIFSIIDFFKKTKGEEYTVQKREENRTTFKIRGQNITFSFSNACGFPIDKLANDPEISKGIAKVAHPLKENRIEEVQINSGNEQISIRHDEKEYFSSGREEDLTKTQIVSLPGQIRSLDKKTKNGKFIYKDTTLQMSLIMEDPEAYFKYFLSSKDVLVKGELFLKDDLLPYRIEVHDITESGHELDLSL